MFEKEAEEYVKHWIVDEDDNALMQEAYKDGAEFGYNKGFEFGVKSNEKVNQIVANEWHYVKDGELPKDTTVLYLVCVYSWDFGLSHLYKKNGTYIPTVCEWNGEYFKALDSMAYSNARNIKNCFAWKEIVLPKESE